MMFTVLHNNIEYPINHIKTSSYQMAMNDVPELSMIVINRDKNPAYPYLNEEAVMLVDGHEWRIKAESEVANYKNVTALHVLFDLIDMPFNQLLNGTYTPHDLLTTILSGTGFTLDLDEYGLASVLLNDFGRKNPWKLLKEATEMLHVEFTVLPGRIIQVRKQLSNDKGQQFRYGYNLKNITKKTNSSDILTHVIINYGEDYSQTATFESPTAGNYDRAHYGDIINDERITDYETARKRAEREFKDIDLSYEIDVARLGGNYELGETVHTIYEPFDDLSITTRIMKTQYEWNGEEFDLTEVTVGNYVFKTADEIIQDQIDKTTNNTNDKIDETATVINRNMTLKFHETDTKILDQYTTITSEYNATITISAQQIRTEMTANITTINGNMQNIRNDVSSVTQTAALIESRVSSHDLTIDSQGTRISSAESSITQQAAQIQQRVSYTDYTGSTITSLINQDPWAVSISASKINLNGAVVVNGSISGATDINITRDITIGRRINFEDMTNISSNAGSIEIEAFNNMSYVAVRHRFYGIVDFSNATVLGLPQSTST